MCWASTQMTAQRLVDGWVLTGNIGRLDEHGYRYLVDTCRDVLHEGKPISEEAIIPICYRQARWLQETIESLLPIRTTATDRC